MLVYFLFSLCWNQLTSSCQFFSILLIGCGRAQQPPAVHRYFSFSNHNMLKSTGNYASLFRITLACSAKPLFAMYSGVLGSEIACNSMAASCNNRVAQCAEWKPAAATATPTALQANTPPWTDYGQQQERLPQPLSYSATADVYMQTLCPSYTMLTYTHTPLLTNFGVSPTWIGERALMVNRVCTELNPVTYQQALDASLLQYIACIFCKIEAIAICRCFRIKHINCNSSESHPAS